jgi:predicted Zn-dependent protease
MSYPVYLGISNALNLGVPLTFLKFSRNAESEADYLGLEYMYKAGYDPNSYVAFFGKVTEEERHEPGSVPKLFQDHPPTPDRVVKCEEEIKNVLPPRPEYLVSTSEFNDVKARLVKVINSHKVGEGTAPTLHRRGQKSSDTKGSDQGKDQPPVLRRHD